jgi:small neutral amino acid transporter SnatA (MarC family)
VISGRLWKAGLALTVATAFAFIAVAPPERCPPVSTAELEGAAQASVDWFARNQEEDGTWLYFYDRDDDLVTPEYNAIRHSGVTMGLYQAAAAGFPGALESADRGMEWALGKLIGQDGLSAVSYNGEVATGSTALLVAALVIRRETTADERYDEELRRLGRFLVAQTEPTGAVLANYDPIEDAPVPGAHSIYYTGEAYWALALLHGAFPGEGWDEAADHIGDYLARSRDDAEHHWPDIPDHWAAYGQAETVNFPERGTPPLTAVEASYARSQAGYFGSATRWVSQQAGPLGAAVRPGSPPRGGGYGVMSEALTNWWLVAQADPRLRDLEGSIAARSVCVAGLMVEAQTDAEEAAGAADPGRVEGAWFIDGETRMDDQQHALAGLLRTIPIVEASEISGGGEAAFPEDDPASPWLWAFALILALNPARAAFGIPRAGRPAGESLRLAALGGLISAVAALFLAAVADPLLDLLDVSEPSFRTAAGIVAAIAGVADFFRRPPAPEPSLAGMRGALVPVAVPVVLRPALVLLALGAGADGELVAAAGALALGIASLAGLTARMPHEGAAGRVLRWSARLLAAGLVACGVLLAIDGALDV